jgi:hypothetical protein
LRADRGMMSTGVSSGRVNNRLLIFFKPNSNAQGLMRCIGEKVAIIVL